MTTKFLALVVLLAQKNVCMLVAIKKLGNYVVKVAFRTPFLLCYADLLLAQAVGIITESVPILGLVDTAWTKERSVSPNQEKV